MLAFCAFVSVNFEPDEHRSLIFKPLCSVKLHSPTHTLLKKRFPAGKMNVIPQSCFVR